jgi:hypothetical protein
MYCVSALVQLRWSGGFDERATPVAGRDYPGTYQQLVAWFPDDQSCVDYLAKLRWP